MKSETKTQNEPKAHASLLSRIGNVLHRHSHCEQKKTAQAAPPAQETPEQKAHESTPTAADAPPETAAEPAVKTATETTEPPAKATEDITPEPSSKTAGPQQQEAAREVASTPAETPASAQEAAATTPRTVVVHNDPKDIEQLAQTLASAFEDDPLINYLHGPHAKHVNKKCLIFERTVLRAELSRPKGQTTIHVANDNSCVAVWHHVGHWKISGLYMAKFMVALFRTFGLRALLIASAMREVEDAHPKEPHMHLFIIGTHKDHQGKGIGSTVISEMLKHCDLERLPAYLESSNQHNLSFYRRHGFELIQQIQGARANCPPIFTMWREPRPIQKQ